MKTSEHTVRLFGFRFSTAPNVEELTRDIRTARGEAGMQFLITPNSSMIVYFNERRNAMLKSFYRNARYILADGMPLVWMARCRGHKLRRLTGSDLFPVLWRRLISDRAPAVFVVANEKLAARISGENPAGRFIVPKMFGFNDDAYIADLAKQVAAAIADSGASYVFLGLGFPKQEKLGMKLGELSENSHERRVLVLLLGASFEFYFGQKARAPQWMQRSGLEWLYRLLQEPSRLWKRYTVDIIRFLFLALRELFVPERA